MSIRQIGWDWLERLGPWIAHRYVRARSVSDGSRPCDNLRDPSLTLRALPWVAPVAAGNVQTPVPLQRPLGTQSRDRKEAARRCNTLRLHQRSVAATTMRDVPILRA
jgi:hypothetical protein